MIQARLSSSRFPGKMLRKINGIPLIRYVVDRCRASIKADIVAVITSDQISDDPLYEYCMAHEIPVFRGSLTNVLDRYVQASLFFGCDIVCRVCGDSPFVDTFYIDKMFQDMRKDDEYLSVTGGLNGFISEVVTYGALSKVERLTESADDLEHVTKYIRDNLSLFRNRLFEMDLIPESLKNITLTIDYEKDLELADIIIRKGLNGFYFQSQDVIKILLGFFNESYNYLENDDDINRT